MPHLLMDRRVALAAAQEKRVLGTLIDKAVREEIENGVFIDSCGCVCEEFIE